MQGNTEVNKKPLSEVFTKLKTRSLGRKTWIIADGYMPPSSTGPEPQMLSHETACILNPNKDEAHVELTIYFSDKNPAGPYKIDVQGERTRHIRFNDLKDPEPVPLGTDYSCIIRSDMPVIVQHTRLDSRQAENALISTIAFPP